MKTPAQRSAISIRVEASIVAVRRGMARQYGTLLSDLRQGATVMPFFRKTEISDAELADLGAWLSRNNPDRRP